MAKRPAEEISTIIAQSSPENRRNSEASILPFDDGRLLVAWSKFYGGTGADETPSRIAARWSKDEGRTWGEPFVLQENIGTLNCMSASLLRLASGRVLLVFGRKDRQDESSDQTGGVLHAMVKWSDDDGKTWSQPRDVTRGNNYWCMTNDRLVQLASGRILYPIEAAKVGCHVWYSDDDGVSWQMSRQNIARPEGLHYAEPTVVEMANGQIAMYIRHNGGNIHIALSDDQGDSWRMHKNHAPDMAGHPDAGPNSAESPSVVHRVPGTNDLLLVWNNNRLRTPLAAAISSDNGETWGHLRNLEEMDGWPPKLIHTYPSLAFLNGNAHLTYGHVELSWRKEKPPVLDVSGSQQYRRLPISWFYENP
jgi:Neuraminidase (sialidase)